MQRFFELSAQECDALVRLAEEELDGTVSYFEFTRLINEQFTMRQKAHIVELLWKVAFSDAKIDKYEEHYVRKIADLLYVPHREFIAAKHRAEDASRRP